MIVTEYNWNPTTPTGKRQGIQETESLFCFKAWAIYFEYLVWPDRLKESKVCFKQVNINNLFQFHIGTIKSLKRGRERLYSKVLTSQDCVWIKN
jgi:hypothetical protein